jgi:oligopeptide transport system permease protein
VLSEPVAPTRLRLMRGSGLLRFSLQRLAWLLPTLWMLITIAFFLMRVAPGGPFDTEKTLLPEIEANLNSKYHLDESLPKQYFRYLGQVARLDFGPSFQYKDWTVNQLIAQGFPVSMTVGSLAMLLAFFSGTLLGIAAALRQNSALDYSLMGFAMLGISIPNFVIAPLLILVLAVYAGWLPAGGWDWSFARMVLPVVTLALPVTAYIARLTRASMIEVLHSNFIRTARAKGLAWSTVIRRHALKPALLPVISFMGPATAGLLTGSVVIERIFSIPGLGSYFVRGALNRDYTLVMGVVIFYGTLIILLNFVADLVYAWLNPKLRYGDER